MPENKTKPTEVSVETFLSEVEDEQKIADTNIIIEMMREITGCPPKMWGGSIIGFGSYTYQYRSGHSGAWPIVGVSPRKRNITVYIMPGFSEYGSLMEKLGKHKTGKSCLYITRLANVDTVVLKKLIGKAVDYMKETYETSI